MREGRIIVTGASKGLGAATARALDEAGYEVVGLSRSGTCPAGRGIVCDMTDEAAVKAVFAQLADDPAPAVGLVNNAGAHGQSASTEIDIADYERVMALNATAVVVASREAYPLLKRAGGGLIVNMGSVFDKLGVKEHLAYCVSKAAVGAITRCLAVEWAEDGISVVNVAPGYVETDFNRDFMRRDAVKRWLERRIPAGRTGTPEEVAGLVAALFDMRSPYLTGETIYLDGGHGMHH
ncbi:MAG: SDR family NAD(P)-dependent oxidoreductase [Defluviicoccus sp.]|nr:SDR family NAD(P)-dependent oxidoreductase [Defluviicoccus sp.]MDE0278494.1 SDR family NAD(P)-dependent oxidoreductase [Defluviicoccus sp.]